MGQGVMIYNIIITVVLMAILMNLLNNLSILKTLKKGKTILKEPPPVSVLVPARNESGNIEKCIISLLNQDYPNFEIIVLDDNSLDDTFLKLQKIKEKYPHLNIYSNEVLLEGWTGKNFACHTLSRYANGDWLLFTDADTVHSRDSISSSVEAIIEEKAELLSLMPDLVMKTVSEKLFMPLVHFALLSFLPLGIMNSFKDPRAVIALDLLCLLTLNFIERLEVMKRLRMKL